jgi:hypothetical protein
MSSTPFTAPTTGITAVAPRQPAMGQPSATGAGPTTEDAGSLPASARQPAVVTPATVGPSARFSAAAENSDTFSAIVATSAAGAELSDPTATSAAPAATASTTVSPHGDPCQDQHGAAQADF